MSSERVQFDLKTQEAFRGRIQRWDYEPDGEYNDLNRVLNDFNIVLSEKVTYLLRNQYQSLKLQVIVTAQYIKNASQEAIPFCLYLRSSNYLLWDQRDIIEDIQSIVTELLKRGDNAVSKQSGVSMDSIVRLTIFVSKFELLVAGC